MEVDLVSVKSKKELNQVEIDWCPLPGSLGESWRDNECDSFLLHLYIFGKNLTLVKKFVKSKELGDILSSYYGKFYRSYRYHRWSDFRKFSKVKEQTRDIWTKDIYRLESTGIIIKRGPSR